MANVEAARGQFTEILNGPTCEGIKTSGYGLVQAAIEYSQHYRNTRAQTVEGRMENRFRGPTSNRSLYTASAVELVHSAASSN